MEKRKTKKYVGRLSLTLGLSWLLMALAFLIVFADTGGTTNGEFTWEYNIENDARKGSGSFDAKLNDTVLTIEIEAVSSVYDSGGCGGATDAKNTATKGTITNKVGTIRITEVSHEDTATCSVKKNDVLEYGETITVSITADCGNPKADNAVTASDSITITYEILENVEVTFYGADGASYGYGSMSFDSSDDCKTIEVRVKDTITLPDAPTVANGNFKGWRVSHDGSLRAEGTSIEINVSTSIYPVIVESGQVAPFTVDGIPYEFWADAAYKALTANNKTIILNQSYKLPITMVANGVAPCGSKYVTGTDNNLQYVVPSGVTLLIPFNDANTLCTTLPIGENDNKKPTIYRKLTMATGTNLIVNGDLSLSGTQCATQHYTGAVKGPTSLIDMEEGSSISVNGSMYVWGFISGSGSVTINSTGTVYESFQIRDWRGGTAVSKIINNSYKVFPISQYYVQNVQVPMKLMAGAKEHVITSVYVGGIVDEIKQSGTQFFGSSGETCLFQIQEGYIIKDYIEEDDRLSIEIHGKAIISDISLSVTGVWGTDVKIDSAKYVLNIPNNMIISLEDTSEVSLNQDIALLPGTKIIVDENAKFTLAKDKKFIVYDADDWSPDYVFASSKTASVAPVLYVYVNDKIVSPVAAELLDAEVIVDGYADLSAGTVYTTLNGANIHSTKNGSIKLVKGTETVTYQYYQEGEAWPEIKINSLWLKNAEGAMVEYVKSGTHGADTYVYVNGYWHLDSCRDSCGGEFAISTTATCTDAGQRTTTCDCYGYNDINCDCHHKAEDIAALGHKDGVWSDALVDGYEICLCPACQEELARRLFSTLDLDYRLNDYIWMNATVTIPASGKAELVDDYGGTIQLVKGNDGTYYLVRKVLSTDLTSTFKVTLSIGEIKTVELDLSFTTFANDLIAKNDEHAPLVQAMINYGKAADDYFPDVDEKTHFTKQFTFAEICTAENDYTPVDGMKGLLPARNEYNGVKLKTAGATIDFANCLGMTLRFKATGDIEIPEGSKDQIVQIGFMIGTDEEYLKGTKELCVESYDKAFIYYGTNDGSVDGSGNQLQGVVGSQSGLVTQLPDDLSQEMRLRFDMTRDQYLTRFAMRPFIVIQHTEGDVVTYTNLYGEQVLYGFEDYCYRTASKNTSQESVNLVVYAWKYALEAARAEFN